MDKVNVWKVLGGVESTKVPLWRVPGGAGSTKILFWRAPGGAGTTKIVVSATQWSATASFKVASNCYPTPHQTIHFLYDSYYSEYSD